MKYEAAVWRGCLLPDTQTDSDGYSFVLLDTKEPDIEDGADTKHKKKLFF
jgi:hypothetical protein